MRISKRQHQATIAKNRVEIAMLNLQDEHGLTDIEMLQAVASFQSLKLKYMLRYERHGDYETPAGIEKE